MCKKILFLGLTFAFSLTFLTPTFAQDNKTETELKGTVQKIAEDQSYIVINGTKVFTPEFFVEDYNLELGDRVEVITKSTQAGLTAESLNYDYEQPSTATEEETLRSDEEVVPAQEESIVEEAPPAEEAPPVDEETSEDYSPDYPQEY